MESIEQIKALISQSKREEIKSSEIKKRLSKVDTYLANQMSDESSSENADALSQAITMLDWIDLATLKGPEGDTVVHFAAKYGYLELIKKLVESSADLHATNNLGEGPIFNAVAYQQKEVVEYLLGQGVELETKNNSGKIALQYTDNPDILELLFSKLDLKKLDKHEIDTHILTPLIENGDAEDIRRVFDIIESVIGKFISKEDVIAFIKDMNFIKAVDAYEETALHSAVLFENNEVIDCLIAAGSDVNAKDDEGETPLCYAVEYNKCEAVSKLLNAGANPNIQDNNGKVPLLHMQTEHLFNKQGEFACDYILPMLKVGFNPFILSKPADADAKLDDCLSFLSRKRDKCIENVEASNSYNIFWCRVVTSTGSDISKRINSTFASFIRTFQAEILESFSYAQFEQTFFETKLFRRFMSSPETYALMLELMAKYLRQGKVTKNHLAAQLKSIEMENAIYDGEMAYYHWIDSEMFDLAFASGMDVDAHNSKANSAIEYVINNSEKFDLLTDSSAKAILEANICKVISQSKNIQGLLDKETLVSLLMSSRKLDLFILKELIAHGYQVDFNEEILDKHPVHYLFKSDSKHRFEMFEYMLEQGFDCFNNDVLPEMLSKICKKPSEFAYKVLCYFLDKQLDVDSEKREDYQLIHHIIKNNRSYSEWKNKMVAKLIQHGADIADINGKGSDLVTYLYKRDDHRENCLPYILDSLGEMDKLTITHQEKDDEILAFKLIRKNSFQLLDAMLQLGLNINLQNGKGRTLLHEAVRNENLTALRLILNYDPDLSVKDKKGLTAKDYIESIDSFKDKEKVVAIFLDHEKAIEKRKDSTVLHEDMTSLREDVISLREDNESLHEKIDALQQALNQLLANQAKPYTSPEVDAKIDPMRKSNLFSFELSKVQEGAPQNTSIPSGDEHLTNKSVNSTTLSYWD